MGKIISGRVCNECKAVETSQWRRDPVNGGHFCNKCGMKKRKFKPTSHLLLPESIKSTLGDSKEAYFYLLKCLK
jgi:hypothetical protein